MFLSCVPKLTVLAVSSVTGLRSPRPLRVRAAIAVGLGWIFLMAPSQAHGGWRTFTTRDGLPTNYLRCILEDRAGNLWFGSGESPIAIRYDGSTWDTLTVPLNGPNSFGVALVQSIMEDHAGNLWFGTPSGLARYDGSAWTTYLVGDHTTGSDVRDILEDRAGVIWVATNDSVRRFDGSAWRKFTIADGLADRFVSCLAEDHDGNIWAGTSYGVSRYDGTTWRSYRVADGLAANTVLSLAVDHAGNVWAGMDGGLSRYDGTNWRTFRMADGFVASVVFSIIEDRRGAMWFGTELGLSRYDGSRWRIYTKADGMASDITGPMLEDRAGNLWVVTYHAGVSRYDHSGWRAFTTRDGLASNHLLNALVARDGNIWVTTDDGHGASRYDGVRWQTFDKSNGAPGDTLWAIAEDHAGNLWFSVRYRGVSRFDGTSWQDFASANDLGGLEVARIFLDHAGNVWVSTYDADPSLSRYDGSTWRVFAPPEYPGGYGFSWLVDHVGNVWIGSDLSVARFDGSTWRLFTAADGVPTPGGQSPMLEDRDGNIWVGSWIGVARFDGSSWQQFTVADGYVGRDVVSIFQDRAGNLWFGSNEKGLSRFDGSTWRTFTTADGLGSDSGVYTILEDDQGNLWFGTGGAGVTRYDGTNWRTFSVADGLAMNDQNFALKDHDGNLWFGTYEGISRYEPDLLPPQTIIRSAPTGPSPSRAVTARFGAFGEPEGIEFSYRLDGGAWADWSASDLWSGVGLSDGIHRLEVRSRDYVTNTDSTAADTTFEIDATPPLPVITFPSFGQALRGTVTIQGAASDARFASYRVEARPTGAASWDPPAVVRLADSTTPVGNGALASWNTSGIPDGIYEVRLTITDNLGLVGAALVAVVVDNQFPFNDETSPARISSTAGGDLYTLHRELHFYFPPHAFDQDALVSIDPAAADSILPTAVRVLPAYEVAWAGTLRKAATLEFATAGRTPTVGTLAIYTSPDGTTWRRLGGTEEPGKVSLAVRNPGRYALFAETRPVEGRATLSSLSFTPRVFSVSNRFANDDVAIGFTLGRSAPVTVRIYSRSGRLVRVVASEQAMRAGGNLVRWDGRGREDTYVPDGLYIVTVEAMGQTQRSTVAVVR